MALLAATLFSWAAARSRRQDALISDNTRTQLAPGAPWHETERRYTQRRSLNVPQEPRNGNCTERSRSMGAACRPMGILSCNHTSAAAPLTDSIKIMQPTHTLLYWKTKSVGGVGWQVYWNKTRGRKLLDSLLSTKETSLIDRHRVHYGHRHNTHSDVNVISQLFVWWRNTVPPKASPDCWNAWSRGGESHGRSGGPRPTVSLMINRHIHNYCSPQRGKVRGRFASESMMCLFTFSAGWVDIRSCGFLKTDQLLGVW